jgi:hypothetical protein
MQPDDVLDVTEIEAADLQAQGLLVEPKAAKAAPKGADA